MVAFTPGDGSGRRLPQWMLSMSSAGQASKPGNVKENGKKLEEGIQAYENQTLGGNSHVLVKCETKRRKIKPHEQDTEFGDNVPRTVPEEKGSGRGRRKVQESAVPKRQKENDPGKGFKHHEKETLGENSQFLAKFGTKRRTGKSNEQDAQCDGNFAGTFPEKKSNGRGRIKVEESDLSKRQKTKGSSCGSNEEQEDRTSTDDDVELTVEDLVTIAEEYIKADRSMKQKEARKEEIESYSRLAERVSSADELGNFVDAHNCNQRSLIPDTNTSKPSSSSTSNEIGFNASSSTGDPAQEMLDLFLGPLLKKTVEKESKTHRLTEDVAFSIEIKRQSQSNVVTEEIAPVTKKKSSLKDMVAMFLD